METEQCRLANINNNFITTQSFYPLPIGLADRIEKKTSYTRQLIEKQEKIKEEIAWNTVEVQVRDLADKWLSSIEVNRGQRQTKELNSYLACVGIKSHFFLPHSR